MKELFYIILLFVMFWGEPDYLDLVRQVMEIYIGNSNVK